MAEKLPENTPLNKKPLNPAFEAAMWKPGESGNPGGRPKKKSITELYEKLLAEPEFMEDLEASIRKMILSGRMVGQLQLKEMAERVEGKVTQPLDIDMNLSLAERMTKARERVKE